MKGLGFRVLVVEVELLRGLRVWGSESCMTRPRGFGCCKASVGPRYRSYMAQPSEFRGLGLWA